MPLILLPASAAAFAPRSAPTVVLGTKVEPWLTQSLKRINRIKRPLNSSRQHERCLKETLAGPKALWTLAYLMLPKAPHSNLTRSEDALVEATSNYQLINVQAYVVHIDMVSEQEVSFKLLPETIDALIAYHKEIYCVDIAANTWDWSGKEAQVKKLQDDFVAAANRYVFRSSVKALEGLEDDGAGELLEGRSGEVKNALLGLFLPLLPPPPRVPEIVYPSATIYIPQERHWWPVTQNEYYQPSALDSWQVIGSMAHGAPTSSPDGFYETSPIDWLSPPQLDDAYLPSPTPSYDRSLLCPELMYTMPQATPPIPTLPLPSVFAQQYGISSSGAGPGNMTWTYQDITSSYPIPI